MIALLDNLRCTRRRLRPVAALLGVVACVAWAHTGMAVDHVPSEGAAAVICLAVMQTGAVLLTGLALAGGRSTDDPRWRCLPRVAQRIPKARSAPARAGPATLQVFLR